MDIKSKDIKIPMLEPCLFEICAAGWVFDDRGDGLAQNPCRA